ncbi:hypothetical protein D3C71_630750 [compost metagenome]
MSCDFGGVWRYNELWLTQGRVWRGRLSMRCCLSFFLRGPTADWAVDCICSTRPFSVAYVEFVAQRYYSCVMVTSIVFCRGLFTHRSPPVLQFRGLWYLRRGVGVSSGAEQGRYRRGDHKDANVLMTATRKGLVSTLSSLMAKAQQTTINMGLINRGPTRTAARAPN